MGAKGQKLGEVASLSEQTYYYYWNKSTGEVHVGGESAGYAVSSKEAWRKANFMQLLEAK